ncbi:hypothetical protein B9Z55_012657 [Caenorhabditis nigoni]|uniref:Uncharacterized protein n=1 Tax=Caenorhabditis nigoni TaxID=1611254 RepID=A0A2G5TYA7_9PELO|nr:hypothetical protein B9Z55_012657 [Caenorhabditis nigoni]
MTSSISQIFFACRRWTTLDGNSYITMISLKYASSVDVEERILREQSNCELGDFILSSDEKLEKMSYLPTKVFGDVAVVYNCHATMERINDTLVFVSSVFLKAICRDPNLSIGSYAIITKPLMHPEILPSGEQVLFVASTVEVVDDLPTFTNFVPLDSTPIRTNLEGELPETPVVENVIVEEIVASDKKLENLRAVVLSVDEDPKNGMNTHCLWIFEKLAEGRFLTTEYKLEPGHFFRGFYMFDQSDQEWNCAEYIKQITKPPEIGGGIDSEGNIWFRVSICEFQPAGGNLIFAQAETKHFGEIIEGESEGTKLTLSRIGQRVKIQRRIVLDEPVWIVVEKLVSNKDSNNQEVDGKRILEKNEINQEEQTRESTSASVEKPGYENDVQKEMVRNKEPNIEDVAGVISLVKNEKDQEKQVILGKGFASVSEKESDPYVGVRYDYKPKNWTAVVLSVNVNPTNRLKTHCVWIFEKPAEGIFTTEYWLEPGDYFKRIFVLNEFNQKRICANYNGEGERPRGVGHGIDCEGNVWFSIIINEFRPAGGNRRFAQATAKYFGDIIEGETEGTKLTSECIGKRVRIQRRIVLGEPVWMVVEILS